MINTDPEQSAKIVHFHRGGLRGVTMSYKVNSICMKVIPVLGFLLFLQPVYSQYNWTELSEEL